jgi:hypothetical protein
MFRVNRSELASEIWDQSKTNSLVITGSPGVGKTWIIAQLIRRCKSESRPCLPLIAEDFDIRSVDELTSALGFSTDVVSFLGSLGNNPILLIDGLDALRTDMSQRAFRELIGRVADQLPQCSIVASIRSFDLQQSELLQQLFFYGAHGSAKKFSEVTIPPFSNDELLAVAQQVPGIASLIRSSTNEFLTLLRNPFNLQLAVHLLESGATAEELSLFQSQVELLGKYWQWRVETPQDGPDRRAVLRRVVGAMIERKALSVPEGNVYVQGLGLTLNQLQSDEVLRKGPTERISFVHNIIFDYAVSRLSFDEESIHSFIVEDQSRTIFFRPSLAYFFHRVWLHDRITFWKLTFSFYATESIPERGRIIPAIAIYEALRSIEEIEQLLANDSDTAKDVIAATLRAIQTLGGLQSPRRGLWLTLLSKLADNLSLRFINEYVALVRLASDSSSPSQEPVIAVTAQKLLRWMWKAAEGLDRQHALTLADIAASRALPIVVKFYAADPGGTKRIILDVLNRIGSPLSGSHEAFWLVHEITSVIENDPALAVDVYVRLHGYKEASVEATDIGGGIVFRLTGTRKQDFESAVYGLQHTFHTFLDVAPVDATIAAVESLNVELQHKEKAESAEWSEFTFRYAGKDVKYRSDYSEIWDHGAREYESLNLLASALSNAAEKLAEKATREVGIAMIYAIAHRSLYAISWKRLLETSATKPAAFYEHVVGLLTVPKLISAPETTVAAGNLLTAFYEKGIVDQTTGLTIEAALTAIPKTDIIIRYEKPESIRDRLLLCIPLEQIQTDDLQALAEKLRAAEDVRKNEPYVRYSGGAMPFSTEDWLRDEGVDTKKPENVEVLEALKPVQEFEQRFLNGTPPLDECAKVEPAIVKLQQLIGVHHPNGALGDQARGTLCAAAETILKNDELLVGGSLLSLCRSIALNGASDASPKFDAKYHLPFDMPSWGSPSPRIEAAQGLSHMLWNWGLDEDVVTALESLSRDEVPAVRYQIAVGVQGFYKQKAVDKFWAFAEAMLRRETTTGVMLALVNTLGWIAGKEPDKVVSLLSAAIARGLPATERHELTASILQILTGLAIARSISAADQQLLAFEADPVRFHKEISAELITAAQYLAPQIIVDATTRLRARNTVQRVIEKIYRTNQALYQAPASDEKREAVSELLRLLDQIVFRLYVLLDVNHQLREGKPGLADEERRNFYFELKPIIELLTSRSSIPGNHYLAPGTAHHVMETLNGVLAYDPASVVSYAAAVCHASEAFSYQFDSMAVGELVKLVEHVLADHKELLRETVVANALGEMLDIFVKAGWPQAMQLTFQLDRAVR